VPELTGSGVGLFPQHTTYALLHLDLNYLLIDLQLWFERLSKGGDRVFRHGVPASRILASPTVDKSSRSEVALSSLSGLAFSA